MQSGNSFRGYCRLPVDLRRVAAALCQRRATQD
jgi:hypothetical protein